MLRAPWPTSGSSSEGCVTTLVSIALPGAWLPLPAAAAPSSSLRPSSRAAAAPSLSALPLGSPRGHVSVGEPVNSPKRVRKGPVHGLGLAQSRLLRSVSVCACLAAGGAGRCTG